jgi:hypothetical protein
MACEFGVPRTPVGWLLAPLAGIAYIAIEALGEGLLYGGFHLTKKVANKLTPTGMIVAAGVVVAALAFGGVMLGGR